MLCRTEIRHLYDPNGEVANLLRLFRVQVLDFRRFYAAFFAFFLLINMAFSNFHSHDKVNYDVKEQSLNVLLTGLTQGLILCSILLKQLLLVSRIKLLKASRYVWKELLLRIIPVYFAFGFAIGLTNVGLYILFLLYV